LNPIELGMAMAELTESPAWKHLDTWMKGKEEQAKKDLASKTFTELCEVKLLQERLRIYSELRGEIQYRINQGRKESKNLEEQEPK
jgi:hypothetical protein